MVEKTEQNYKGYRIANWALIADVIGQRWHARAEVSVVKPSGRMIVLKRFSPAETYSSKVAAEQFVFHLCEQWVDALLSMKSK